MSNGFLPISKQDMIDEPPIPEQYARSSQNVPSVVKFMRYGDKALLV